MTVCISRGAGSKYSARRCDVFGLPDNAVIIRSRDALERGAEEKEKAEAVVWYVCHSDTDRILEGVCDCRSLWGGGGGGFAQRPIREADWQDMKGGAVTPVHTAQ